jgi:hypothetical protein
VLTAEKMLKRVRFARCPPSGAVLFSDACYCGSTVEGKYEWVKEDEEPAPQEQDRFELKIMIFGIIGKRISRFKVYPAKTYINAAKYKECFLPIMKGRRSSHVFRTCLQDNASAHIAAETVEGMYPGWKYLVLFSNSVPCVVAVADLLLLKDPAALYDHGMSLGTMSMVILMYSALYTAWTKLLQHVVRPGTLVYPFIADLNTPRRIGVFVFLQWVAVLFVGCLLWLFCVSLRLKL